MKRLERKGIYVLVVMVLGEVGYQQWYLLQVLTIAGSIFASIRQSSARGLPPSDIEGDSARL